MKPELFAVFAVLFYAMLNVVLDRYMRYYAPPAVLLICYAAMAPLALASLGYMKWSGQVTAVPKGVLVLVVLALGIVYFFADFFYLSAFASGGKGLNITMIFIMLPVLMAAWKYVLDREVPTTDQAIAFAFAVGTLYFSTRG